MTNRICGECLEELGHEKPPIVVGYGFPSDCSMCGKRCENLGEWINQTFDIEVDDD